MSPNDSEPGARVANPDPMNGPVSRAGGGGGRPTSDETAPHLIVLLIVGFALTGTFLILQSAWMFTIAALVTGAWPTDDCDPAKIRQAALLGSVLLLALSAIIGWVRFGSAKRRAQEQLPESFSGHKQLIALVFPLVVLTTAIIAGANIAARSNICGG